MDINVKNLSKEQIADLKKQIAELEKVVTYDDVVKVVKPTYYVTAIGSYFQHFQHGSFLLSSERRAKQLSAIIKMMNVADYLNSREVMDVADCYEFYIYNGIPMCTYVLSKKYGCVYFNTHELALKAIEILGEETIKEALGFVDGQWI